MKTNIKILLGLLVIGIASSIWLGCLANVSQETYVAKPLVTHAQETWIRALEWCESRGVITSINPKDKDNTPSYYSFQFKPGTFRYYGETYGVIKKGQSDSKIMEEMKSFETQELIVENMIGDKTVVWKYEFPDCVRKHIGQPPVY